MMLKLETSTATRASLAMDIVEDEAVAEEFRPFAEDYFTLKGGSYLTLRALSAFRHVEEHIENGHITHKVERAIDRVLSLLLHVESTCAVQVPAANDAVELAIGKVVAMKEELKRLDDLKQQVQGGTTSRGRVRQAFAHN